MTRPTLEVADILRAQGDRFLDRYRSSFDFQQLKAFRAIQRCRTAALGGHQDACPLCGHQAISYNSCRNRHCPKCQAQARQRWLAWLIHQKQNRSAECGLMTEERLGAPSWIDKEVCTAALLTSRTVFQNGSALSFRECVVD